MPDALILGTADLNADIVLTGDDRWLKISGLTCELRYIVASGAPPT
jgi:hypothetical protein